VKELSVKKYLVLGLCFLFLFSVLIVGCKPKSEVDESSATSSSESGNVSNDGSQSGETSTDGETSTVVSDGPSNTSNGHKETKAQSKTTSAGSRKLVDGIDYGVDPAEYRGRTVRYATWKDPAANEDGPVVKSFEQKFGIKVQIDIVPQGDYVQRILGMISANNSPDIFFNTMEFPSNIQCLQPLTTAKMNLSDPFWDQTWIEATTFGGEPYCIAPMNNIWGTFDVVTYNKKLFKDNGIPTPDDFVENGTWTFENMKKIMRALKAVKAKGAYIRADYLAASQGAGFIKYDTKNRKFVSGINDPMLVNVYKYIAECKQEDLLTDSWAEFINGKVGMVLWDNFGMKKTGHFQSMPPEWLGYAPYPDYDETHKAKPSGMFRDWGIIKGAKEPVAAGIFLRYYCDSNNYNMSNTFINSEAATEHFQLVNKKASEISFHVLMGCIPYMGNSNTYPSMNNIAYSAPDQVAALIKGKEADINAAINNIHKALPK